MSENLDSVLLEARQVTRRYAGIVALDRVDFRAYRGKVNVLIGENGAGKSTLMRVLAGVEAPDEGTIYLGGEEVDLRSPRDAAAHGIMIVHQELSVLPNLTVSENIFAGRELTRNAFIDERAQNAQAGSALKRLKLPVAVGTEVGHLSLGSRQLVELARSLAHPTSVLILDEPTSALSTAETDELFKVIAELKRSGTTIIYISHRLHELLYLGDHFTVLRSGRGVGTAARKDVTRKWIVERMTGREVRCAQRIGFLGAEATVPAMEVRSLSLAPSVSGAQPQSAVSDVSFTLKRGEVLGIYGLLGSGRTEVLECLAGLRSPASGQVLVDGEPASIHGVTAAIRAGLVLVPEDRQRDGLIPDLSVRENIVLALSTGIVLSKANETRKVRELTTRLGIVAHDLEMPVSALSGGNQQKVLIARCLARSPKILLLDEPTRGVDAGAKTEIYRNLSSLAEQGLSILFTSSEVEEMQLLADRSLVLCQGRIVAELVADEITDQSLFSLASPLIPEHATLSPAGNIA